MLQCGICSIEVLGTGSVGTQPSVILSTDNERVLFECGDGTQRLCTENSVRVSKISRVYLGRNSPYSNGGLGGFLLTRSDLASCERTSVIGPPGTAQMLRSFRHFYQRPNRTVSVFEIGCKDFPHTTDDGVIVTPILLGGKFLIQEEDHSQKKIRQVQSQEVLRGFELHESLIEQCGDQDLDFAASYLIELPQRRGKFRPDRAVALGVKPGPDFGRLTKGETIHLPNGKIVRPEDCMDAEEPAPLALILNCPSYEHMDHFMNLPITRSLSESRRDQLHCVIHFSAKDVILSTKFQSWSSSLGKHVKHIVLGENFVSAHSPYRSSSKLHTRLSVLDSQAFPLVEREAEPPITINGWDVADTKMKYTLLPSRVQGLNMDSIPLPVQKEEEMTKAAELLGERPEFSVEEGFSAETNNEGPEVIFLGTGSAIPSKYRNVSALLVQSTNKDNGAILVDCGEGSLGQIARAVGSMSEARELLRNTVCVWISHMHADHHLGLLTVLAERSQLQPTRPLVVAGPTQLNTFLQEYGRALGGSAKSSFLGSFVFLDNEAMLAEKRLNFQPPALRQLQLDAGVSSAMTVPVLHCYKAYGLVLESIEGWKLVYSGDTEYCQQLIEVGTNASVLIHEATFEDGKESEAKEKKHSTISQALQSGAAMKAKTIVLTHFSQRYPKNPPLPASSNLLLPVFAFDLMHFSPNHAKRLSEATAYLDRLLGDENEDDDESI